MSKKNIVYFCMEYGLHPTFNNYAGGLGILAGDILKAAKDNDHNLIGIGILWGEGYTDQYICGDEIINKHHNNNYNQVEITDIEFEIDVGHQQIKCNVYKTEKFGNAPLYLIDTNNEDNKQEFRNLTSRLYSGNNYQELLQQAILGIAGMKTLEHLDIEPSSLHLNESDSVFAALEILKEKMQDSDFEAALDETKDIVKFTTHTPISAGNPVFDYSLFEETGLIKNYDKETLHWLSKYEFNTTLVCLRLAGKTNAVSQRHLDTARNMWKDHKDTSQIVGITNGVHLPTWQAKRIKEATDAEELWRAHMHRKKILRRSTNTNFDIDKPLIGFARRITEYKRPKLIFTDQDRAKEVLDNFNIILAGKAHPDDGRGREMVLDIYNKAQENDSIHWIENYNMFDGFNLVSGCDIWLSTPLPPKEACSTSTIKAATNGVLNVSTPDGWWWEACEHGVNGWKFGKEESIEDRLKQDWEDSQDLYDVLLNEVLPVYRGSKTEWINMMQNAIQTGEQYSAKSLLEKYQEELWS